MRKNLLTAIDFYRFKPWRYWFCVQLPFILLPKHLTKVARIQIAAILMKTSYNDRVDS